MHVPPGENGCDSQGSFLTHDDSQDDDCRINADKTLAAIDIAVFRQQAVNISIFGADTSVDYLRGLIHKPRGYFKSEINKQSLGIIVDCDDGPECHTHHECQRHAPTVGRYLSKLLGAGAVELQYNEYIIIMCVANS